MAYATRHTLQEYKGYFALLQIIYIESLLKAHIIIDKGYLRTEQSIYFDC